MGAHLDVLVTHARLELDRTDDAIASTTLGDWVAPDASPGGGNPPEDSRVPATAFLHQILATVARAARSEEHTSELQSLMRISYAVFCLKKKQNNDDTSTTNKATHKKHN